MGVKSTVYLSKSEAVDLYFEKLMALYKKQHQDRLFSLPDEDLEDAIEELNDQLYDQGFGYENYIITDDN